MTTITITLSNDLAEIARAHAAADGHTSPADYIRDLIVADCRRMDRRDIEAKLLESLEGPSEVLDEAEWEAIRREARESPASDGRSLSVTERRRAARKDLEAKLLEGLAIPTVPVDEEFWDSIRRTTSDARNTGA